MNFSEIININIPEGSVSKITDSNGFILWEQGLNIPDLPIPLSNEIYYTSTDGKYISVWLENNTIISNKYVDGVGKIICSDNIIELEAYFMYEVNTLKSIRLPDGLLRIGDLSCFAKCENLEYVYLPESLEIIGITAFSGCTSLRNITIPNNVKEIGIGAFAICTSLENIVIPNSVYHLGYGVFDRCTLLKNVVLSNQITEIPNRTFYECTSLENIVIPNINFIGESVFYGTSSLKSIVIPDSVTETEVWVFRYSGIENITISKNLKTLNYSFLGDCKKLNSITCLNPIAATIQSNTFQNVADIGTLRVPENAEGYETWLEQLGEGWTIEYITE